MPNLKLYNYYLLHLRYSLYFLKYFKRIIVILFYKYRISSQNNMKKKN